VIVLYKVTIGKSFELGFGFNKPGKLPPTDILCSPLSY